MLRKIVGRSVLAFREAVSMQTQIAMLRMIILMLIWMMDIYIYSYCCDDNEVHIFVVWAQRVRQLSLVNDNLSDSLYQHIYYKHLMMGIYRWMKL